MLKRIAVLCSVIAITLSTAAKPVFAEESENSETGTLKVEYYSDSEPIRDSEFQLHAIGSLNGNQISYNETFASYQFGTEMTVTLPDLLWSYIQRDELEPIATKKTDTKGGCQFDNLKAGLYLISGPERWTAVGGGIQGSENGETTLGTARKTRSHPQALLVDIKAGDTLIVEPKVILTSETLNNRLSVVKVWKTDNGQAAEHPTSITVDLLKEGEVEKTVELNEANNWSYTWDTLSSDAHWSVVESKVPNGYRLTSEIVDDTVVLTNTKVLDNPGTVTTPTPNPTNPNKTNPKPTIAPNGKLPQTGMLQYPILCLCAGSIITAIVGAICLRKAGKKG